MTAMTRFFRRLRFRQAAIAVAFVCAAGALSACGGGGGGGSGGDTPTPPGPPISPVLPFVAPAIVHGLDGLPVQGLHYVRVGDRDMVQSEATDENGLFNPRSALGRGADEVLFGVGPFSVIIATNGDVDYEFANEDGFPVAFLDRDSGWSERRIDIVSDSKDGGVPKDSLKRYLASIFPTPAAPAIATRLDSRSVC